MEGTALRCRQWKERIGARASSHQDNQRRKEMGQKRLLNFLIQAAHTVKGIGTRMNSLGQAVFKQ